MKLAGKYLEFEETLDPQFRSSLGPGYENITADQQRQLQSLLRLIGTSPPGTEEAVRGMILLSELQNEIGASQAARR
jgi:hypothetical protein